MLARRTFLSIHRYCGLAVAALIAVQSLTGLSLVYRNDLARLIDPDGMTRRSQNAPLSVGEILQRLEQNFPHSRVERLFFPQTERDVYFIQFAGDDRVTRYASVDPGAGEILRSGTIWRFPTEAALQIHYKLMSGRTGSALVSLTGLAILLMMASGIAFWIPPRNRWRSSLSIDWRRPGRLVLRQVHRSAGVLMSLIIAVSAVTGLLIAIPMALEASSPQAEWRPLSPTIITYTDDALGVARQAFPQSELRDVRFLSPQTLAINFFAPERSARAVHTVTVDAGSLRITALTAARDDKRYWVVPLPIHTGEQFGPAGRVMIFLGGATLLLLSVSGPLMWLHARRSKARKPAAVAAIRG